MLNYYDGNKMEDLFQKQQAGDIMKLDTARIIIAGTGSGSGKTTITAGILQCLKNRGLETASFKCGPDYIDPMFHSRITGRTAGTLDPYFCDAESLRYIMASESEGYDLAVAEGVMGYYDGIGFTSEASTFSVAKTTKTPVVLVIGCRGIGASAGAVLKGFLDYAQEDSRIRGVIFNQISPRLAPQAMQMAEQAGIRPIGYLPPNRKLTLESRHLGLVAAGEIQDFQETIRRIAEAVEKSIDLDALLALASEAESVDFAPSEALTEAFCGQGMRIAVSFDAAFSFLYKENVEMLEKAGCEVVFFSPLREEALPEKVDGLILSGGYPELYADQLSANGTMRESIRKAIDAGLPTIAECGGFLYLHETLEGSDGVPYPMTSVVQGTCADSGSLGRFGYIEMTAEQGGLLCEKGGKFRAHEFHYWDSTDSGQDFTAVKPDGSRSWSCGFHSETLYAGFPHIHFAGCPDVLKRYLEKCREYRMGMEGNK